MKKLIASLLALLMLLSLAACGGKPAVTPGDTPVDVVGGEANAPSAPSAPSMPGGSSAAVGSYAQAYDFYYTMTDTLSTTVDNLVEANNTKLEETSPDTYFSDPNYLILFFMPFISIDLAFTATFDETTTEEYITAAFSMLSFEDVKFTKQAPNQYVMEYTSTSYIDDQPYTTELHAQFIPECSGLRYVEYHIKDGARTVDEFYEFVSLGNNKYALQSKTDRAVVTYANDAMTEISYSSTKHESGEEYEMTQIVYDPEADTIIGKSGIDDAWVTEKRASDGLSAVYTLKDGTLTLETTDKDYIWSGEEYVSDRTGATWTWKEPIIISAE